MYLYVYIRTYLYYVRYIAHIEFPNFSSKYYYAKVSKYNLLNSNKMSVQHSLMYL